MSMGNPHFVIFVDAITDNHVLIDGPLLEKAPEFPNKINVEFVTVIVLSLPPYIPPPPTLGIIAIEPPRITPMTPLLSTLLSEMVELFTFKLIMSAKGLA